MKSKAEVYTYRNAVAIAFGNDVLSLHFNGKIQHEFFENDAWLDQDSAEEVWAALEKAVRERRKRPRKEGESDERT